MFSYSARKALILLTCDAELSLRDGLIVFLSGRRRKSQVLGAPRPRASCPYDGALVFVVAEIHVDHANGLERRERFCGREVKRCGLEFLFDEAVKHKC
jgi:hypothetical protein